MATKEFHMKKGGKFLGADGTFGKKEHAVMIFAKQGFDERRKSLGLKPSEVQAVEVKPKKAAKKAAVK